MNMKNILGVLLLMFAHFSVTAQLSDMFNPLVANVKLQTLQGDTVTLAQIVESKADSLVFIDFWASWCKPCIQEIPHAVKLKSALNGEKISFVFISTDEDVDAWKDAQKFHKSNTAPQYRLIKEDKSTIRDYFRISGIPYYILIDISENRFLADAPWPSNNRCEKTIRKWLK